MADEKDTTQPQEEEKPIDKPEAQSSVAQGAKGEATSDKEQVTEAPEAKEEKPVEKPKPEAPAKEEPKKKIDTSNLTDNAKKVMDMVSEMKVLELAELVKVLEDKFGVSAAPVAVAAAGGAAAGGEAGGAEEKSAYNINLVDFGSNKIGVIKAVREVTELGLKEAKDLVEAAPKLVRESVKKAEAEEIKKKLEAAGAKVELQ